MAVLTLSHDTTAPSNALPAGAALHLRRRGEQEVRTIPLAADKFTIGSSPRCHVRLPASEAQPLQCLLTLEAGAATVTRWAAGVLLNGREFTKSAIHCGDRLAIGDWEIGLNGFGAETARGGESERAKPPLGHVFDPEAQTRRELGAEWQAAGAEARERTAVEASAPAPTVCDLRAVKAQAFTDRVVFDLWTASRAARERAKKLAGALRTARREAALATESFAKRQAALEAALAAATAEQAAAKSLSSTDAKRQAALEAAELECNSLRARLESHAAAVEELRSQVARVEAGRQAAEDESLDHMQLAEDRAAEAARLQAELQSLRGQEATARDEAVAERARLVSERDELAAERDQLTMERKQLLAERDALVVECDGLRELLETTTLPLVSETEAAPAVAEAPANVGEVEPAAEGAKPQAVSDAEPTSFIEKYRHLLEEDGEEGASVARRPALLDDEFLSPAKAQTCPPPDDDSDEALEAYMSSMMQRVRGTSSVAPVFELTQSVEPTTEAPEASAPAAMAPDEFTPLKHATRKAPATSDLATLREIANVSARTAIANHHKRRHHESAVGKLLVAAAASSSSAYVMSSAPGIDTGWFWAGIFAGVVGAASAIQVINTERRVRAEKRLATESGTGEQGAGGGPSTSSAERDAPAR